MQYPASNLTLLQTDPTGIYAPGCAIFGTATLTAADFWDRSAHRRSGQRGPGNATTGIADLADYYKLLSARNLSHASTSSPTGFSSRRNGRRGLIDQVEDLVTVRSRGRFSLRALWLGAISPRRLRRAQFKQAILGFSTMTTLFDKKRPRLLPLLSAPYIPPITSDAGSISLGRHRSILHGLNRRESPR